MGKKIKTQASKKPAVTKTSKICKVKNAGGKVKETKKDVDPLVDEFPTVQTDSKLKEICDKTAAVERKEAEEEQDAIDLDLQKEEELPAVMEKVKVKRKDSLIKKQPDVKSKEKSFLSLSNPAEDDKKIKTSSYAYKKNRGVVYLSHIPHGFYEKQMREFFSQFGTVTNLRLGRSKKSGKSRGFAFVEFKYSEVAKVVAETMNNYLMFNKIIKAELLSKDKYSPKVFNGKVNPARPPLLTARRKAKKIHNAIKTESTNKKRMERQMKNKNKVEKQLEKIGIGYKIEVS